MKLGDAYTYGTHPHVVISDPDAEGRVVVVNISHHEDNRDQSCVIEIGEHPLIIKKSVVLYKATAVFTPEQQRDFERYATKHHEKVSDALLERIVEGTDSDYIPQKAQKLAVDSWRARRDAKKVAADAPKKPSAA